MARSDTAPQGYDVYFGLNVIATVALLTGLLFLYLDYSSYAPAPKAISKTQAGLNLAPQVQPPAPGLPGKAGKS
jgi:hypothetical protein